MDIIDIPNHKRAFSAPLQKAKGAVSYARTAYREYFRHRQWGIGKVDAPIHRFLDPHFRPRIQWVRAPRRDEYLADPFGLVRGGRLQVFCEKYQRRRMKGTLVTFDWPPSGAKPNSTSFLPLPVHASYPFLIEQDGHVYCVPETSQAGEVALYEADPLHDRWTKVATLLSEFPGVDSTVFEFDGRWWMSATHSDAAERHLYLWYAERLEGPWQPHPKNPVLDSLVSARPAGTPFVWRGALYRPAQDCSKTYGGRVAINIVEELSRTAFEERVVAFVDPDPTGPYPLGLHTLSFAGDATLIDGFRNVFSRSAFRRRLAQGFSARRQSRTRA